MYILCLYTIGSVDWDAEWQKVVKDQDQPSKRPGKYKTQAEIAASEYSLYLYNNFCISHVVFLSLIQNFVFYILYTCLILVISYNNLNILSQGN